MLSIKHIFRLAIYPAVAIGLTGGAGLFLMLHYTSLLSGNNNILVSVGFALFLGLASYIIIQIIQRRRIETVDEILKNISNREFKNYSYLEPGNRDELDQLIQRSVQVSDTVEGEIKQMDQVENYRKEFIGDISHELKTPIFAIQGFIETLLDGAIEDPDVNRRFLKKAMRHANRLIYLTQDLMEISQLETGELESNFQSLNLRNLIMDVLESLQHRAEQEGITLQTGRIDPGLAVYADRHQIRRVLTNLVDNAIKYNTENGSVTVEVEPYGSEKRQKRVLVSVRDTGIGIEEDKIERVTERFYRVDKSRSRQQGGTGLGLSIVKHIMEVHGEELFIESSPGEGSTFSFTLTEVHYPSV